MQCHYNTVTFLQNIHKRYPIARLSGRGMRCLLWVQPLIDILPQFLQWCVQYHVILDRVITALDCTIYTMPADVLAPGIDRTPAAMLLISLNKPNLIFKFNWEGLKQPPPLQRYEMTKLTIYFYVLWNQFPTLTCVHFFSKACLSLETIASWDSNLLHSSMAFLDLSSTSSFCFKASFSICSNFSSK